MSLPQTCPFCGSGSELRNGEKWIGYTCITTIHAGHDARRLQSITCAGLERTRLLARVAELEERCKRLEEAGDEMADWNMTAPNLGCDPELLSKWQKAKEAKP